MELIAPGADAPPIDGVEFGSRPTAVFFYKVTCPVCQMVAPKAQALEDAYPRSVVGVGEDPPGALERFGQEYGMALGSVPDDPPFPASDAYGIEAVPTLFLVGPDGVVDDVVQSWDREGYNRISARLADLRDAPYVQISDEADGLPAFRPG
jgi:thiol-disulfide isomerase/thioredoxin